MTEIPTTNWARSVRYSFRDCLSPASIEELRETVANAPRIKVLGSGHSFNLIADSDVALKLAGIPLNPEIGDDGASVSIAGHATYGDLANFLRDHKLAVHNLASLPHISIAGAIATATHGSGSGNGNLATAVRALEFIAADGSVVTVKRGEPDFEGMVVHLGALGVVSRVTLDVQPAFDVAQTVYEGLGWTALYDHLDAIMDAAYSTSIFTNWGDQAGQIWLKRASGTGEPPVSLHGTTLATVKRHPLTDMDPTNSTDQFGVAGLWSDRLPHFKMGFTPSNGDEIQSEFHIPRKHGANAIRALHAARDGFAHLIQVTELRSVAADTLWLSPQYQRDTLSLHFTWLPDNAGVDLAVKHLEEALAPFEALPHWGKVFTPIHVGARYAMLSQFKAIRDRLDPTGKFSNPWLDAVLFGKA